MRDIIEQALKPFRDIKAGLQKLQPKALTPEALALRSKSSEDMLFEIWRGGGADLSMFAKSFFSIVPAEALREALVQATELYGPALSVGTEKQKNGYFLETSEYRLSVLLERDRNGLVKGFFIKPPLFKMESINDLMAKMAAEASEHALIVKKNGEVVYSHQPDKALAVSSSYMLFVLKALNDKMSAQNIKWRQKIRLKPELVSYPEGSLYKKSKGALVPLQSAAQHMMVLSDNSCADVIIDFLGASSLEDTPERTPFLTSKQFFKLQADTELAARYKDAEVEERRAILEEIDARDLPSLEDINRPVQDGVEWYASANELAKLIDELAPLPPMAGNSGFATAADWLKVAFKGGSQIGVMAFTYNLQAKNGTRWQVSMIWNDEKPLNEGRLMGLSNALLSYLKDKS
ncbi:serine hydrolase [Rhodobacteraceae bacterium RKSG542]|uniref:serine hydrolase n=1 Tax=Pseudovibrio flavus TaxID=2529854 RepID=UPI0012BBFA05|nr:serine hydrolase [Pseudovibrio flavus]MTI17949.1 serine hydrolase [Pseudovibrio flavus]